MNCPAFSVAAPLRLNSLLPHNRVILRTAVCRPRPYTPVGPVAPAPIQLKKGGAGSKRSRKSSQKPSKPARAPDSAATPSAAAPPPPADGPPLSTPADAASPAFPGPLAPEVIETDGMMSADGALPPEPTRPAPGAGAAAAAAGAVDPDDPSGSGAIPIADESTLKLPDVGARGGRVRRKRKQAPVSPSDETDGVVDPNADDDDQPTAAGSVPRAKTLSTERVAELTAAYRLGGPKAQEVINELEKEPDFLLRVENAAGEYDLTSAMLGIGRPNKQGIYVLPYLQSGHVLLLGIGMLVAFVYYPGFPLTEATDEVRLALQVGIALALSANAVLAFFAAKLAKERNQPPVFWLLKTMVLGELAFGELRRNTRPKENDMPKRGMRRREKRRRSEKR